MIELKRRNGELIALCNVSTIREAVEANKFNLRCSNLRGADLRGAENIVSLGPIGREGRIIYAVNHGTKVMVQAGCFCGDLDELANAVSKTHGESKHGNAYRAAIAFIRSYAEAYWN